MDRQTTLKTFQQRLEEIKYEVAVHDYNTYVLEHPLISDSEYQNILQEKYTLELKLEALTPKQTA